MLDFVRSLFKYENIERLRNSDGILVEVGHFMMPLSLHFPSLSVTFKFPIM